MKKQSLNFLILVLFCLYLSYSCGNLKSESNNSIKTNNVPDYKPFPRPTFIETTAHEDISFSDRMFYAKFNIKDRLPGAQGVSSLINSRLVETQIYIPINLAKLDIELYVQYVVGYRHDINMNLPFEYLFELYFADTLIGEQTLYYNSVIATNSLYLQGTVYHVPAGNYQTYMRLKVNGRLNSSTSLTYWHIITDLTNPEWTRYLHHEYGYIEYAGIGGN